MTGELTDTRYGLAVATEMEFEGAIHRNFRLVNGHDGHPVPGKVYWRGSDTWHGIGFTVATNPLPEATLTEIVPMMKKRRK